MKGWRQCDDDEGTFQKVRQTPHGLDDLEENLAAHGHGQLITSATLCSGGKMKRYAEEANYWVTMVHPTKSQSEIMALLENFGADKIQFTQGQAGGKFAWLIRFEWKGHSYRFTFAPLECKTPRAQKSFKGKRRTHFEQSRYQMARVAVHFVKAILTAAEAHPHALFGFLELPETASNGQIPRTAGELDVAGVQSAFPVLLPAGKEE
jgi:hypothetical protein